MTYDLSSVEVRFAIDAVVQASRVTERVKAGVEIRHMTKNDLSPVTVADFAGQAIVAKTLSDTFPGAALVAEEEAGDLVPGEDGSLLAAVTSAVREFEEGAEEGDVRSWIELGGASPGATFWTLDPIDGTKGYLRGGHYAVALALVEDGEVQIGALACPNLNMETETFSTPNGTLLVATRGGGSWVSNLEKGAKFSRVSVSERETPGDARLLRSVEAGHTSVSGIDALAEALGIAAEPVLMDSQAKYAVLATGRAELLVRLLSAKRPDYKEKIWDQAAGSIVVEEAGGRVTDLNGRQLDFSTGRSLNLNTGICATNGYLHEAVLEALRQIQA